MTGKEIFLFVLLVISLILGFVYYVLYVRKNPTPKVDPQAVAEFYALQSVIDQWLLHNNTQTPREVMFEFYKSESRTKLQYPYLEELEVEFRHYETALLLNLYYGRTYTDSKVVNVETLVDYNYFVVRFGKVKLS